MDGVLLRNAGVLLKHLVFELLVGLSRTTSLLGKALSFQLWGKKNIDPASIPSHHSFLRNQAAELLQKPLDMRTHSGGGPLAVMRIGKICDSTGMLAKR